MAQNMTNMPDGYWDESKRVIKQYGGILCSIKEIHSVQIMPFIPEDLHIDIKKQIKEHYFPGKIYGWSMIENSILKKEKLVP